jgi:hypothetical protein
MAKPDRAYGVTVPGLPGKDRERRVIFGETFFAARAATCTKCPGLEPGEVRLDVEAQSREGIVR